MGKRKKDSFRHITKEFAEVVVCNPVYQAFYGKHPQDVIVGIRSEYINLYHCGNSIAKITVNRDKATAIVNDYFKTGIHNGHYSKIQEDDGDLDSAYVIFAKRSLEGGKDEKQAQERLFIDNNNNPDSNWYCIDVEYTKSFASKDNPEPWRFDIIAVSKSYPHRVALIELKYGSKAIGGKSGVQKHIKDYYQFHKDHSYEILLPELISIIYGLKTMSIPVPKSLSGDLMLSDFADTPEYYFITLNNNLEVEAESTPQMTMSGYLFTDKKWGCKKVSSTAAEKGFYCQVNSDTSFRPFFKFSKATLPELGINDIIDSPAYENAVY